MKTINLFKTIVISLSITMTSMVLPARAAVNQATDPGGGSQSLIASGNVTVNSSTLQLVKQVYDAANNCLASMPADAACNSSATTVTVPAGTAVKMLIFVKNPTAITLTDIRFLDALDISATGFAYTTGTIRRTQIGAAAPADTATAAAIFADANGATGTALTDAASALDQASFVTPNVSVGAATNATVSINANKAFGIVFTVTKQ